MKTKVTKFRLTLDTEIEVNLSDYDFKGMNENQIKEKLIKDFLWMHDIKIEVVNDKPFLDYVFDSQYQKYCDFYEIELERELTHLEKLEINNWLNKGQNYNLHNELMK